MHQPTMYQIELSCEDKASILLSNSNIDTPTIHQIRSLIAKSRLLCTGPLLASDRPHPSTNPSSERAMTPHMTNQLAGHQASKYFDMSKTQSYTHNMLDHLVRLIPHGEPSTHFV